MKRLLLASAVLLPMGLLAGCGGNADTGLKIAGLLFLTGVIGKRGVADADAAKPLGRAQIAVRDGRGSATLHLNASSRLGISAADVRVVGTASADGTFDLSGGLPDGSRVRIAGRSGDTVTLTIGATTTEHTSVAP